MKIQLSQWRPALPGYHMLAIFAVYLLAVVPQQTALAQLASPTTAPPTNTVVPGKVVWADLVTNDVDAAVDFYTRVFAWEARHDEVAGYVELSHRGVVICSVVAFDDDDVSPANARWLVSVSVPNVDDAVRRVELNQGSVLEAPENFPDRGRLAVVSDDQAAVFMLLRATGGDPVDDTLVVGAWGWAELWTRDVDKAVRFYENAFGYRSNRVEEASGESLVVLGTQGKPRATVVRLPWDDVEPNWLPYIPVEDARDTLRRIETAGGTVLFTSDDVGSNDRGTFAAIVVDPTGGVFAVQETEAGQ